MRWERIECNADQPMLNFPVTYFNVRCDGSLRWHRWDYTPYPCGAGREGFRSDAAYWPGGGVWLYLQWVVDRVLPFAESNYGWSAAQTPFSPFRLNSVWRTHRRFWLLCSFSSDPSPPPQLKTSSHARFWRLFPWWNLRTLLCHEVRQGMRVGMSHVQEVG